MIIGIGCDLERVAAVEDAATLRVPGKKKGKKKKKKKEEENK